MTPKRGLLDSRYCDQYSLALIFAEMIAGILNVYTPLSADDPDK